MAKYKNDPANEGYRAGDYFDYEVWTANTELTLCNVPWDAIYKDVVHFESTNALNRYIDNTGDRTSISNAMYARIDEPISIDMPLGRAQKYNYIRVYNPAQPVANDQPKYYYYFIRAVRHVAPETTEIIVQLDVWQTYSRLVQFGRAYIDRGHIGIANADNFKDYGRRYLTIAEGLDTGSDYVNVAYKEQPIMKAITNTGTTGAKSYFVMAVSTVDLNGKLGTKKAPDKESAKPNYVQGTIPSGAGVYVWESALEFMAFMNEFSRYPWITSGIVSITLIPDMHHLGNAGSTYFLGKKDPTTRAYKGFGILPKIKKDLFKNWRTSKEVAEYIPARYRHLKKLWTSPYCMLELTFNAGSAVILKPENWNNDHASLLFMMSTAPPNQRLAAIPMNYNGRNKTRTDIPWWDLGSEGRDGDWLDTALFLSAFPTIPIVNDGQILALAQSARSIAAQYNAADWSQQKALQGNQVAFDQATAVGNAGSDLANNAMGLDAASTAAQNDYGAQKALNSFFQQTGMGAAMGLVAGPPGAVMGGMAGAASGGLGMWNQAQDANHANNMLAIRAGAGANARDINTRTGNFIRDSNKGLADWAARGDYANARAQMDAKIQDTKLTPSAMSGQFGGESFNHVVDEMNLTLRVKMIDQASIAVIGEYWLRYGYPVRRSAMIPNDLRVMTKFSYWKMSEIYIRTGGMPESFKQALRGILEKGVTVWSNPDDIGAIDFADNQPLPGIVIEGYTPPPWEPETEPEPPTTTRRKKRNMLVFATDDGGMKYALAGTSPGTTANWIETDRATLASQYMNACGVTEPVVLEVADYYATQAKYLEPLETFTTPEGTGA